MDPSYFVKAFFLMIPVFLLGCMLFERWRWPLRLPAAVALGILLPLAAAAWVPGIMDYLVSFCIMASIYAVMSLGLNVQWGYNGHLNFGVAAFFGMGMFTMALFVSRMPTGPLAAYAQQLFGLQAPFVVGLVAAAVLAGVLGYLVAQPVLHLRADFLAIATLGIAEIVRLIFQNERWLANGPQPFSGIPQPLSCMFKNPRCGWLPEWFTDATAVLQPRDYSYLYLVVVVVVLGILYVALEAMMRSPWGRALRAVRDEETSAAMSGKHVKSLRVQSFVLGCVVMGIAGGLYAPYMVTVDYSHLNPLFSTFLVWVMLMLGGSGNNRGAILGAFVVWGIWSGTSFAVDALRPTLAAISPELPQRGPYLRLLFISILMLVIVLYRPSGILPEERVVSLDRDLG